MATSARLNKLYSIMEQEQLDAFAFIPGANLYYLAHAKHILQKRPLILIIPKGGEPVVILPKLEAEVFEGAGFAAKMFDWSDAEGYETAFQKALAELNLGGKKLGVEGIKLRFFEAELLRRHVPTLSLVQADDALARLRVHKDADELAHLRAAIKISQDALQTTLGEIKLGMSEMQITNMLVNHMVELGSEGMGFEPIVLAGDNTARPHGAPRSDYYIQKGDPLLFDYGAMVGGYTADITRTFFVGEVSDHFRHVYETVKAANAAGRQTANVGVRAGAVDEATRQVLIQNGYEHLIVHRTGHGLGLDIHEDPYILLTNNQILEPGMVFTIEPGLYESGAIGVRIEDDMVITESGAESFTTFPRDLTILEV